MAGLHPLIIDICKAIKPVYVNPDESQFTLEMYEGTKLPPLPYGADGMNLLYRHSEVYSGVLMVMLTKNGENLMGITLNSLLGKIPK